MEPSWGIWNQFVGSWIRAWDPWSDIGVQLGGTAKENPIRNSLSKINFLIRDIIWLFRIKPDYLVSNIIIWGQMWLTGVNSIIWDQILSFGIHFYHKGSNPVSWEPIQLSGIQSDHLGLNLINLISLIRSIWWIWSDPIQQFKIQSHLLVSDLFIRDLIWSWGSYLIFHSDHLDSCPISPDPISPDPIQSSGILSHQRKSSWAIQVLTGA